MEKDIKVGLLTGLSFAGLAYIPVKLLGFGSRSFMIISYLYIVMALYMMFLFNRGGIKSVAERFLGNLVLVREGEELLMRKLATGEKYRIKGEVEKLQ